MSAEIESLVTDAAARRTGSGTSPMLVALAVLALVTAAHAQWRIGRMSDSLETAQAQIIELRGLRVALATQQSEAAARLETSLTGLRAELTGLRELPSQVEELSRSQAELRARTETPQRAWVRAEALYLLELAGRRLELEGDVRTAMVAMESADARLATLHDPGVSAVRSELAKELTALRAAPQPDVAAIVTRIGAVESRAKTLPVLGIPITKGQRADAELTGLGPFERAWLRISTATRDLLSLRRVEPMNARLVTQEEEALRRQHLELLLVAARIAAMQGNAAAYSQALKSAIEWVDQCFDARSQAVRAARREVDELGTMTVAAPRPPIGAAAQMLRRLTQGGAAQS